MCKTSILSSDMISNFQCALSGLSQLLPTEKTLEMMKNPFFSIVVLTFSIER